MYKTPEPNISCLGPFKMERTNTTYQKGLFHSLWRNNTQFEWLRSYQRTEKWSTILNYPVPCTAYKDIRENRTGTAAYGHYVSALIYNLHAWFLLFYYCRVYLRKLQFCKCVNHAEWQCTFFWDSVCGRTVWFVLYCDLSRPSLGNQKLNQKREQVFSIYISR
jgi:hypothetical protein